MAAELQELVSSLAPKSSTSSEPSSSWVDVPVLGEFPCRRAVVPMDERMLKELLELAPGWRRGSGGCAEVRVGAAGSGCGAGRRRGEGGPGAEVQGLKSDPPLA